MRRAAPAAKPSKALSAGKIKQKQQAGSLTGMKPVITSSGGPAKVNIATGYGAGKIIIDQSAKKLYYTVSSTQAYVYPVAVGKKGFKWTGTKKISREVNWPDWRPPAEMRKRKPHLPAYMAGGVKNPLGAKALYLGNSLYRIHGTNDPASIGTEASSGCIRMHNGHVVHLASMAGVGTTVHVVNKLPRSVASN
jgi:lipoprotein-anchoring transpeptidase ErfK/SrfK